MLNGIKVLIVEDYAVTALDLSKTLEKFGCEITGSVRTGEEAIEKAVQTMPDIILMDIMLKGYYNGIETAGFIRKQCTIPVIYLTALNDDETFLKAHNTNPAAILHKPFNEKELTRTIKKALALTEEKV